MRKSLKSKGEEEKTKPEESENDDDRLSEDEISASNASPAAKKRKSKGKVVGPRSKRREVEEGEDDEESKESLGKESNDEEEETASLKKNKRFTKGRKSTIANNNDDESMGKESNDEEEETMSSKKNKRFPKGRKSVIANNNDDEENVEGSGSDSEIPLSKKMKAVKKSSAKNGLTKAKKRAAELEEKVEYEVESVVGCRLQRGKRQFRIRWKGFKEEEDTWENEDGLDCAEAIEEYLKAHPENDEQADKKTPKTNKKADKTKAKIKDKNGQDEEESGEEASQEEYEVDRIRDVFIKKNGKREFLIRWKGYGAHDDTWEPEEHLNCADLIKKYEEKIDKAKSVTAKELRVSRKPTERFTLTMASQGRRLSRRGGGKQRIRYDDAE